MKVLCPVAKTPGKRVKATTVVRMVRSDLRETVPGREWYFCEQAACEVVYFAEDGTTLLRSDVTVRVGAKEEFPPHTVCYCFGHSVESIRDEVERTGESTVFDSITAKVQAGECSCEELNPKGTCCLGDVRAAVKAVVASDGAREDGAGCGTSCCEEE